MIMNMANNNDLKKIIEEVLRDIMGEDGQILPQIKDVRGTRFLGMEDKILHSEIKEKDDVEEFTAEDLSKIDISSKIYVPSPFKPEQLDSLKRSTPARIAVWRSGTRYKTETMLRFLADHAAARDAVHKELPENLIERLKLPIFQTKCTSKDEFLTRPDLGRRLASESREKLKNFTADSQKRVVIFFADGLSTTAIDTNGEDTYRSALEGFKSYGIEVNSPFLIKYGRVPIEDEVSEITGAEVVVLLIGERPGLATAESMSAYIAYKAAVGMDEARRTVISNIHKNGTPAIEAGAYIADIVKTMLEKKASGLDLKL